MIELRRKYLPAPQVAALEQLLGLAPDPDAKAKQREDIA